MTSFWLQIDEIFFIKQRKKVVFPLSGRHQPAAWSLATEMKPDCYKTFNAV